MKRPNYPGRLSGYYDAKLDRGKVRDDSARTDIRRLVCLARSLGSVEALEDCDVHAAVDEYRSERTGKPLAPNTAATWRLSLAAYQRWVEHGQMTRSQRLGLRVHDCPVITEWGEAMDGKAMSGGTIRQYTAYVAEFLRWVDEAIAKVESREAMTAAMRDPIMATLFEQWQAHRAAQYELDTGKKYKRSSVASVQAAIRSWCLFLKVPDVTDAVKVTVKKGDVKRVKPITRAQRWRLFEYAYRMMTSDDPTEAAEGTAWFAVLILGCVQGLRIGSIVDFRPADIELGADTDSHYDDWLDDDYGDAEYDDTDAGFEIIMNLPSAKGHERKAALEVDCRRSVAQFFANFDPNIRPAALVLPYRATASTAFSAFAKKAGVPNCTPHRMRAFAVTEFLELFGDRLLAARDLVGHASTAMTERYVHLGRIGRREPGLPYPTDPAEFGMMWLPESFAALLALRDSRRKAKNAENAELLPFRRRAA